MAAISHTHDTATLTMSWSEALILLEACHRLMEDFQALIDCDYESDEEPDLELQEHLDFAVQAHGMIFEAYRAAHPRPVEADA
jgi:hypothetical protein